MKKHYTLLVFFFSYTWCFGQQLPFNNNMSDHFSFVNPAAKETFYILNNSEKNFITLNAFYQHQWAFQDINAPFTAGFDANIPTKKDLLTFGGGFFVDRAGAISLYQSYGRVKANLLRLEENKWDLSIGFSISPSWYNLNFSDIDNADLIDPIILDNNFSNAFFLRASAGMFFRKFLADNKLNLFGGLSVLQLKNFSFKTGNRFGDLINYNLNGGIIYQILDKDNIHFLELSSSLRVLPNLPNFYTLNLRYHIDLNANEKNQGNGNLFSIGLIFNNYQMQVEPRYIFHNSGWGFSFALSLLTFDENLSNFGNQNTFDLRITKFIDR